MAAFCRTRRSRRCSTTIPRRNSLVFAVHIWNPHGSEPETIWQVMNRQKDIQYSSRAVSHVARQKQLHRLRHVVSELVKRMPESERQSNVVHDLAEYGCLTRMHVVRLLAPTIDGEDHTKDIDFSPAGIRARWEAGYADTRTRDRQGAVAGRVRPDRGLHPARGARRNARDQRVVHYFIITYNYCCKPKRRSKVSS